MEPSGIKPVNGVSKLLFPKQKWGNEINIGAPVKEKAKFIRMNMQEKSLTINM